jgi:hypothetical protein
MTQLAPDLDAAADRAAAVTFAATTRHGALRLSLRRATPWPPRIAASLRAAALLADAESLLQWLEDWLGEPLDPAPADAPAPAAAPVARLRWHWGEVTASVELPWPALLACRPAPEVAGFWRESVRWDELALQLVLAHEDLCDDEWQALQQPGAGWLLRESFSADGHWPCELRLPLAGGTQVWPALWQPGRQSLTWREAAPPAPPGRAEQTLAVLAKPLRLTPPALLGWHGETGCDCAVDQPVSLLPAARHGRRALAASLLPVGLRAAGTGHAATVVDMPALHAGYVLRVEAA